MQAVLELFHWAIYSNNNNVITGTDCFYLDNNGIIQIAKWGAQKQ